MLPATPHPDSPRQCPLALPTPLTDLEITIRTPRIPQGGSSALLQGFLFRLGVLGLKT